MMLPGLDAAETFRTYRNTIRYSDEVCYLDDASIDNSVELA